MRSAPGGPDLVVRGIGTLLTGDIARPLLEAEAILINHGRIAAIGNLSQLPADVPSVDVNGATVLPGLIDNHVHPVLGDFTPRQSQANFLEGFVHGGVTAVVSAGEVHTPGRPRDAAGTKALAVLAHKAYESYRPGGIRVHCGALLLEDGLVSDDFIELASQGVHLVGEVGISGVKDAETAAEMTKWAQSAGMTVTVHVGGKSVAGSRSIDGAFCARVHPDVAAHVNGGPTAPSTEDVEVILSETNAFVELVHNGNVRAARDVCRFIMDRANLDRVVVGTDSPAGAGIAPAGIFRTLAWLCALADLPPAAAVAMATGNTAKARRIPGGLIEVGAPADLVIADAPDGSTAHDMSAALQIGDTPAVAGVVIDGQIVVEQSRNTAPPRRLPSFPPKYVGKQ